MLTLVATLALYMNEPVQFQAKPQSFLRNQILKWDAGVIAFRGGSLEAPENTKQAIQQALQLGVQGVHMDIRKTANGVFVLAAEENLKRVTGQEVLVSQTVFENLPPLQQTIVSEFGETYKMQSQQEDEKSTEEVTIPSFEEVSELFVDNDAILVIQDHTATINDSIQFLLEVKAKGLLNRMIFQTEKNRWEQLRNISPVPLNLMEPSNHIEQRFEEFATGQFQQQEDTPETDIFNTTFNFETVKQSPIEVRQQVLSTWTSRTSQIELPQNPTFEEFAQAMEKYKPFVQLMNWNYQQKARVPVAYFPVNKVEDLRLAKQLGANMVFTEAPAELLVEQENERWVAQQWNQQR